MNKTIINPKNAPTPIGPYNQCVKIGDLIYTAGQIPLDPKTGNMVEGGIKEQTKQVLENLKVILEAAGSDFKNVVKATVFLKDMNQFAEMNEVYAQFIDQSFAPARSTIQVARLPKDALVEIEMVAVVK